MNYKLAGRTPVPCDVLDPEFRTNKHVDWIVGKTTIGNCHVSTVFLWLDHSPRQDGSELFETMVFGESELFPEDYCERYATYEEAEAGHLAIVEKLVRARLSVGN